MPQRSRSLTDRLLVRAWIEPAHERPLRVVIRHRGDEAVEEEQAFADPVSAAAFVRAWLMGLLSRWEGGESSGAGTDTEE
jgi:hypothetical protein